MKITDVNIAEKTTVNYKGKSIETGIFKFPVLEPVFGEHVIGSEVEQALNSAMSGSNVRVNEFTVAPQINPTDGLPYHEWFIEFDKNPENLDEFSERMDEQLQQLNSYYFDLIKGKILKPLVISCVKPGGFNEYMKSMGKLGGQNKVPRLSNDRKIADGLSKQIEE